jgi:pimeloyl-ACP methyl ester carboxylesterase
MWSLLMKQTIMLIHGAWLNASSCECFKSRYEARGFDVVTPDWPCREPVPANVWVTPDPEAARKGYGKFLAHLESRLRTLPAETIIMGHSAGAIFTLSLLDRGYGIAGVAIDPAPTAGGKLYWDGELTRVAKINWDNPCRAPLLLIGGGNDLIPDAALMAAVHDRLSRVASRTDLIMFRGRSHWTCLEPGWEQVADQALDWALQHADITPGLPRRISVGAARAVDCAQTIRPAQA